MACELAPEPAERVQKRRRGEGTGGNFFVLGRDAWERLYTIPTVNRLNLVLAYLVLLAGTGSDHRLTKWSVGAIHDYTGMRKESGRKAVGELIAGKMIERAPTWTESKPHHHVLPGTSEAEPIFLPIQLVRGLGATDTPMLRRVRETGDALALRLLIDLYGEVTLDAPHAVSASALRGYADGQEGAERCLEMGAHAIWELVEISTWQAESLDRKRYVAKGESVHTAFWDRVRLLGRVGATYTEPWVCSGSSSDADPIFPLSADARVQEFANLAGRTLIAGADGERAYLSEQHPGSLVVLPVHHRCPAIIWLTKMRVEADTPGRRAAYGERERVIGHWIEEYSRLVGDARQGNFSNPVRTQPRRSPEGERPHQGHQGHQGLSRASS